VQSEETVLHKVSAKWVVYSSQEKKWKEATHLQLNKARSITLGGSLPDDVHSDKVGKFVDVTKTVDEAGVTRTVYAREGRPGLMLWWSGNRWWLGKRDEFGLNRGWVKVESSADEPYKVERSKPWVVWSKRAERWLEAPNLTCKPDSASSAQSGPPVTSWSVVECKEGGEPAEFWSTLGGKKGYSGGRRADVALDHPIRLFHCSNETGAFRVEEVFDFSQEDLEHDDVFILDTFVAVYVWVGNQANDTEKGRAMETATKYVEAQSAVDGRAADSPAVLVKAGSEPAPFTIHFVGWSDTNARVFEDPYEKRKRLLSGSSAPAPAAPKVALKKTGMLPGEEPLSDSAMAERVATNAVQSAMRKAGLPVEESDKLDADKPASGSVAAAAAAYKGASPPPATKFGNPTSRSPVKSFVPSMPDAAGLPAPKKPSPPSVEPLDMSQIGPSDGGAASARRRALAAKATAAAVGMNIEEFANPETDRFTFEDIKTQRTARSLNPICRELYLADDEFFAIFGMTKKEFYDMKLWRQRELKKQKGLF